MTTISSFISTVCCFWILVAEVTVLSLVFRERRTHRTPCFSQIDSSETRQAFLMGIVIVFFALDRGSEPKTPPSELDCFDTGANIRCSARHSFAARANAASG
jgi:hypothetical protein